MDIRKLEKFKKGSKKPRPLRIFFDVENARDKVISSAYNVLRNKKEENRRFRTQLLMTKVLTVQGRQEGAVC